MRRLQPFLALMQLTSGTTTYYGRDQWYSWWIRTPGCELRRRITVLVLPSGYLGQFMIIEDLSQGMLMYRLGMGPIDILETTCARVIIR